MKLNHKLHSDPPQKILRKKNLEILTHNIINRDYFASKLQVLSMSKDDYRNASFITAGSFEQDVPIPDLVGATEILSEEHRYELKMTSFFV